MMSTLNPEAILVQGSKSVLVSPTLLTVHLPVDASVNWRPIEGVRVLQCTVTRQGMETFTCHVCEGGHHVHISWDTWAY